MDLFSGLVMVPAISRKLKEVPFFGALLQRVLQLVADGDRSLWNELDT